MAAPQKWYRIKADIAAKPGKNSYTAWDEAGRIQNDFINYLLSVNCHTMDRLFIVQPVHPFFCGRQVNQVFGFYFPTKKAHQL
mgnify:CR=1 FL=1